MAVGDVLLFCPVAFAHGPRIVAGPADIESRDDVDPAFTVGGAYAINGKVYTYVKFNNGAGNIAAVAGQAAYIHTAAAWSPHTGLAQVTSDASDALGADGLAIVVGVFRNVITDGQYGFIQSGGVSVDVLNNGEAGDRLLASSTDGQLNEATAGGDVVEYVGVCLENSA